MRPSKSFLMSCFMLGNLLWFSAAKAEPPVPPSSPQSPMDDSEFLQKAVSSPAQPQVARPRFVSTDKSGPVSIQVLLGPAVGILAKSNNRWLFAESPPAQLSIGGEVGYGFGREGNIILLLSGGTHYLPSSGDGIAMVEVGLQFDVSIGIPGLFLYPRWAVGWAGNWSSGADRSISHSGVFTPAIGLKYVVKKRVNLGIDLVSFPVQFDPVHDWVMGMYRTQAHIGVNL